MATYRIKGWGRFQHFKNRRPLWIKLYRDILDDPEFHALDGETAKHLVMLWLIASDSEVPGTLPGIRRLSFRMRETEKKVFASLSKLSHWVELDDITPISNRYQNATPEERREREEREKEKEREGEKEKNPPSPPGGKLIEIPDDLKSNESDLRDWLEYKRQRGQPYKPKGLEAFWTKIRGIPADRRRAAIQHSMASNYQGLFEQPNGGTNGRQGTHGQSPSEPGKYDGIATEVEVS